MAMNIRRIISVFALILVIFSSSYTTEASVSDFCVADTSKPTGPAGYSCKNPDNVTSDAFFYSLATKGDTANVFNLAITRADAPNYSGVNGLDISMFRVDFECGGVVPFHSHPGASEIILIVEGEVLVGFISSDANKVYTKVLKAGEIFVVPRGLLHFQINMGDGPALEYAAFNSAQPRVQTTDFALFANDLQTDIIRKTTLIKEEEIQRLKHLFGGTN